MNDAVSLYLTVQQHVLTSHSLAMTVDVDHSFFALPGNYISSLFNPF